MFTEQSNIDDKYPEKDEKIIVDNQRNSSFSDATAKKSTKLIPAKIKQGSGEEILNNNVISRQY